MCSGARRLSKSCSPVSILVYVFMTIETCEDRPSNGILGAPTIADLPPVSGQRALRPPPSGALQHRVPPGVVDPLRRVPWQTEPASRRQKNVGHSLSERRIRRGCPCVFSCCSRSNGTGLKRF